MKKLRVAFSFLVYFVFCVPALADTYQPFDHLLQGIEDFPNTESLAVLGAGTALTLVSVHFFDPSVHRFFAGQDRLNGWEKLGNFWGTGIPGATIGAGTLGYGLIFDHPHEVNAGEAHLEGLLATLAFTGALKYTVRRERPNGGHYSFPSGHTSTAFTTAANLMDMYGPIAGVPALLLGFETAASRIAVDVHWLSDTIFGAALGYAFGHSYAIHHQSKKAIKLTIAPYFESRSEFGLISRLEF